MALVKQSLPFGRLLVGVACRRPVQYRSLGGLPTNWGVVFVPQQQAWVVERMGKFKAILEPGIQLLIPVLDRVRYVQSLKEIAIDIPTQSAISLDNVQLQLDGVLYLRVVDPYKASYGVEDPEFAITQLAQTTMRSEVGKINLDTVFRERERLNENIVEALNKAATPWGITCDMKMPPKIAEAMQMQVEAERKKRASILESEGVRAAEINVAEGRKQSTILASEAERQQQINQAFGEAEAVVAKANAKAKAIAIVAQQLDKQAGQNAATLTVAEQYVRSFSQLAKHSNTLILPANAADAGSMIAQAMTIYKQMSPNPNKTSTSSNSKPESITDSKS